MWQIQWMISLIPDSVLIWIYYSFISAGLIGYIGSKLFKRFPFKYIPFLGQYPFLSELLGVVLLSLGLFLYGGLATELAWRAKVAEAQAKVEEVKKESDQANADLVQVRKQKQKVVKEYYATVHETIKEVEKKIDADCKLDPVVPKILNEAASNPLRKGTVSVGPVESEEKAK
jgi:hypothetical protein